MFGLVSGQGRRLTRRPLRTTTVGVAAVALWFAGSAVSAQAVAGAAPTPSPTVAAPVRVGGVPPAPTGATPLTPPSATATIQIDVVLQPRDPGALAQFATDVSTPGNPLFRHYLKAGQFPDVFGPTDASIAAVEAALRAEGLHPGTISTDHLSIPVTATTAQLAKAFSVGFRRYRLSGGRVAYANTAAPLFPGNVAGLLQGVIGLDDLEAAQPLGLGPSPEASTAPVSTPSVTGGPQPCAAAVTAGSEDDAYTADQFASAYQYSSLYGAGDLGSGQSVALFELASNDTSDISTYQTCYGTNASVSYVAVDGGATTSDGSVEAILDIEDVIGLAPKASIVVYQGPNTPTGSYDTYSTIVGSDTENVVSTSWGLCEAVATYGGSTGMAAENTLFELAAGQGQSIFAAAGDTGSEGCERGDGSTALGVLDPASQPFVTGVGGTTLWDVGPPPTETVWNETNVGAGGGGISAVWTMPSYQSGAPSSLHVINSRSSATPCAAGAGKYCREVPDVSADASLYLGYLIYYTGSDTGLSGWQAEGGTSAATPLWGALMALTDADSACSGTPVGFANPGLYAVAGTTSYGSAFHDITSGNNDYGDYQGGLYPAGTGYDMASGLGTPNGSALPGLLCAFTTAAAPAATTGAATAVDWDGATLHGTVNPNGSSTTYKFQYGLTTSYGMTTSATSAGSGSSVVAAAAVVTGLSPNTLYDFRLVATNLAATTDGSNATFTTPAEPPPPTATTGAATAVDWDVATLNGTVNPNSTDTSYQFQYGPTTSYGMSTTATDVGSGSSGVAATAVVTGLSPDTTYDFQLLATSDAGTSYGSNATFTTPGEMTTAVSTQQYKLTSSDGGTWQAMDATDLSLTLSPATDESVLLSANADLWTADAGYNQDIGIEVTPGGGSPAVVAWKESGGFAGTYSPNAAFVETVYQLAGGTTYTVEIVWKTNKPAIGMTIAAGAGAGPTVYSPTRLTAEVLPAEYQTAVSTQQYSLTGSDGATWQPIDLGNLSTAFSPTVDENVVVSGNADLWTANAGYNQDLGIFVSVDRTPATLVAWKESGGFAGTYSPNAAYVQTVYPLTAGDTYVFSLEWKTNLPAAGATIDAGAGAGPTVFSPTRLTVYALPADSAPDQSTSAVSTVQYSLANSDGSNWVEMDSTDLVTGSIAIGGGGAAETVLVSGNVDLWTATATYNQDIGIFVSEDGGTPVLVAWKESGGFAGTYSPNAAFVETAYTLEPGHSYVFSLWWKTNKPAPGATIDAGAGAGPTVFSPTRLTVAP